MATKPTDLPRWATDAGRTLEPTSGEKDTGWQAGYKPPARKMNWLFNTIYDWIVWLAYAVFRESHAVVADETKTGYTGLEQYSSSKCTLPADALEEPVLLAKKICRKSMP